MADKNIQMQRRNVDNTAWEKLYPVTTAGNVNTVQGNTVQIQLDTLNTSIGTLNNNVATAQSQATTAQNQATTAVNNVTSVQSQLSTHANTAEIHRKITYGNTPPSTANVGDIFLQY